MNLPQLRKFALSLPEATEEPHFHMTSFRVRKKIFVTTDPEKPSIHVFVGDEVREPMLAMHPECVEKLMWGQKVVGLRVSLEAAAPALVKDLVKKSWQAKAPKTLLGKLSGE